MVLSCSLYNSFIIFQHALFSSVPLLLPMLTSSLSYGSVKWTSNLQKIMQSKVFPLENFKMTQWQSWKKINVEIRQNCKEFDFTNQHFESGNRSAINANQLSLSLLSVVNQDLVVTAQSISKTNTLTSHCISKHQCYGWMTSVCLLNLAQCWKVLSICIEFNWTEKTLL